MFSGEVREISPFKFAKISSAFEYNLSNLAN